MAIKLAVDVVGAVVAPEGRRVALLGRDQDLRTWDVTTGQWLGNPIKLEPAVSQMEFSPNGERVVTIGSDQGTQVWDPRTGERVFSLPGSAVAQAQFSPDSRLLVATLRLGGARVWDTVTVVVTPPLRHGGHLASASFCAVRANR